MNRTLKARCVAAAAGIATSVVFPAWASGKVEVDFKDPQSYADIGWSIVDRESNLRSLAEHMRRWGSLLPDGQQLEIEVLDVDLAGEVRPWWHLGDVRVLNGRVDGPRMRLRWTLKAGDRQLRGGEEKLSDVGYLTTVARLRSREALAYDTRMLDDWLRDQVLEGGPVR